MKFQFVACLILAFATNCNAVTLRILVVYSPNAATAAGGDGAIAAQISVAGSQINQALSTSGISHNAAIVGTYKALNGDTWGTDVTSAAIAMSRDKLVRQQRNLMSADMVIMISPNFAAGVSGYTVGADANNKDYAFAAVLQTQATATSDATHYGYSFSHEFGHIMGLRHQKSGGVPGTDDASGIGTSHGYWWRAATTVGVFTGTPCWHSIMSYPSQNLAGISCNNVPDLRNLIYSNPSVNWSTASGNAPWKYSDPGTGSGTIFAGLPPSPIPSGRDAAGSNEASIVNANAPVVADFHNHPLYIAEVTGFVTVMTATILSAD